MATNTTSIPSKLARNEESYGDLYILGLPIICDLYAADATARIDWDLRVHPMWRRFCSIKWSRTSRAEGTRKAIFANILQKPRISESEGKVL